MSCRSGGMNAISMDEDEPIGISVKTSGFPCGDTARFRWMDGLGAVKEP